MNIKDKVVIIIGASGTIGRHLSYILAMNGAKTILVGRDRNRLSVLKKKITEKKGNADVYVIDILSERHVDQLVKKIQSRYKIVDILLHTAGVGIYEKLDDIEYKKWKLSMDINVNSVFLFIQKFLPLLSRSKEAHIIATGSGMGKVTVAGRSAYCASKFALRGLMLSLAKEYKGTNIHFNLLTLGSVLTSFGPLSLEQKIKNEGRGKKYLQPAYLAHLVVGKLRNDTLEAETSIYPKDYYRASLKGKV